MTVSQALFLMALTESFEVPRGLALDRIGVPFLRADLDRSSGSRVEGHMT